MSSTPEINEFDPTIIPFQKSVLKYLRKEHDFSNGAAQVLLSGSVGSAKSLLMAHIIATHALMYPNAGILVGRRTLRDLKNTIWAMLLSHAPMFYQYWNKSEMKISLPNGSIIYGVSWDDGKFDKFRSYEISLACIEELTENPTGDVYKEILMRIGRSKGVKENAFICATNPDSPAHWAYEYFIDNESENRKVFYSKTEDNPFLPKWYLKQLRAELDPKMAKRMLYGEWIEISKDQVYYNYVNDRNFIDMNYKWKNEPICIMHDFNIGKNKPMSSAAGQYINDIFHIGKNYIVDGARTIDILDVMAESGIFDLPNNNIFVFGDASGRNNDTRSLRDDYDIIEKYLSNYVRKDGVPLEVHMMVPRKNPPVRRRHNVVNSHFLNDNNEVRLFLYKGCERTAKGFRLTQFKKDGFIEDDSLPEQHVTTAVGYWVDYVINKHGAERSKVIQL